uniref:Uncharacterized protein n=1 Tax=Tetranychus urticae TaxID=32264 RepID=T1KUB7_TETUR
MFQNVIVSIDVLAVVWILMELLITVSSKVEFDYNITFIYKKKHYIIHLSRGCSIHAQWNLTNHG